MLVHLNLGSNIEPRREYLSQAVEKIGRIPKVTLMGSSRIYETEALGLQDANALPFYNTCLVVRTPLKLEKLLGDLERIESELGRPPESKRKRRSRTVDIDIVLAEDAALDTPRLKVPHPGLFRRSFFLWPLLEICPNASCPRREYPLKVFLPQVVRPPILRTLPGFDV